MDWTFAWQGLAWGLLSAVSLPVGAALGLWGKPSKKVTSALMAFGGGALLFALAIELFGHALHASSGEDGRIVLPGIALSAMAAGALGGILFFTLNRILEGEGGFLRKRSLIRKHIIREKRRVARAMLDSLGRVALLHGGMRIAKVMWMWVSLCLLTGAGALLGTVLLPGHPTGAMVYVVFGIEGLAAGAMLTMIAQTMLPEAYEQGGGGTIGLATLAGFLAAMAAKLIH